MDSEEMLAPFRSAVEERDQERLGELCRALAADIRLETVEVPERTGQKLLELLRGKRQFKELVALGAPLRRAHPESARILHLYAQGLIDSGQLDQALDLLEGTMSRLEPPEDPRSSDFRRYVEEFLWASGLIGRVHKQWYVDSPAEPERKAKGLRAAVEAYARGWTEGWMMDRERRWHGINIVALLARAERDGVPLETEHDLRELASELLDAVDRGDPGKTNLWDDVIAMEAALALGETETAIRWAERYVEKGLAHDNNGEFEFASTLRQLEEVWQVDPDGEFGSAVIPLLDAAILDQGLRSAEGSGAIELETRAVARMNSPEAFDRLQRVFGDDAFVTTRWLHTLFDRLAGVGVLANAVTGTGIGTGFMVQGSTLAEDLGEEWYFVTNSHVVTDDEALIAAAPSNKKPSRPEDVEITFEVLFDDAPEVFKVKEVVFTSPPDELDVSILRLDRPVYEGRIKPYPVSMELADPADRPRLYIAGHPGGGGLRISMHDNHLIDFDDRRIHYRTPTNPGSSGSPVFNDEWKLVGLHHAGSSEMPKLDGSGEVIEANEGIRLGAILEGFHAARAGGPSVEE